MNVKLAGGLRITMASAVVLTMIVVGVLHRSPWIVALATPAFTALYALGKWNAWMAAWRLGGARQIALAILVTLPIQAVVAGVFYLIGLGLGRLVVGPAPLSALSGGDVIVAAALLAVGVAASAAIIRLEDQPAGLPRAAASPPTEKPELDIDPTPLTLDTFFKSPEHWRTNASQEALEQRGATVVKPPLAAREDMIAAAEARLGVRLPETLRKLYGVMNGGYVGELYVPLKVNPRPIYDDWRGAFSIDYSSLVPLEKLRTVADHYEDFTHDPEDVPANADRLIILQARYGDMTLLDYSRGPEARVLIADYDKHGQDPLDIAFEAFDDFFAALRREHDRDAGAPPPQRDLSKPLGDVAEANRPRRFWGEAKPHPFYTKATYRKDGSEPKLAADDALIAETEARLGVKLPPSLVTLWRAKNGGGVSSRFIAITAGDNVEDLEVMRFPVPLEYVVSLADLSDRIVFPPGETPWTERHPRTDRLIVLEAEHGRAALLDYRGRPDGDPALLLVNDLDNDSLADATRFECFDDLLARLRFQRRGWEEVAKPHSAELSEASA